MYVMINGEKVESAAWAIRQDGYTGLCVYADDSGVTGVSIEVVLKANELNRLATRANLLEMGVSDPDLKGKFTVYGEVPETPPVEEFTFNSPEPEDEIIEAAKDCACFSCAEFVEEQREPELEELY